MFRSFTVLAPYSWQVFAAQPLVSQVHARGVVVQASVPGPWPSDAQSSAGMKLLAPYWSQSSPRSIAPFPPSASSPFSYAASFVCPKGHG